MSMASTVIDSNTKDADSLSEESESTHESDLDCDITLDIQLPNGEILKLTVLASTPWSDLRAKLFSQFKLSPSSHVVTFDSASTHNTKHIASRPVGKMLISLVTIRNKAAKVEPAASPQLPVTNTEKTVRLMVRMARLHQSIFRVHPDSPLSAAFNLACERFQLGPEAKSKYELRHPTQHDMKLNLDLSLNHYQIKEVSLVEVAADKNGKAAHSKVPPPPPSRTKRKAPRPPSSPPLERPEGDSSQSVNNDKNKSKEKPKPPKRRAAPPPPKNTSPPQIPSPILSENDDHPVDENQSVSAPEESQVVEKSEVELDQTEDVMPSRPPRRSKLSKSSVSDSEKVCDSPPPNPATNEVDVCEDEHVDVVAPVDDKPEIVDDEVIHTSPNGTSDDVANAVTPNDETDQNSSQEFNSSDKAVESVDDVMEEFDEVINTASDDIGDDKDLSFVDEPEAQQQKGLQVGDITVYDVEEEQNVVSENHESESEMRNEVDLNMEADREEEPEKEIVLSPPDPLLLEDFPPPPPPEDIPSLTSVTSSPINNDVSENTSSNDIIDSSQVTSSQNQISTSTTPCVVDESSPVEVQKEEKSEELEEEKENQSSEKTRTEKSADVVSTKPKRVAFQKIEEKEMSESEKTAIEIEQLHQQIKKMRSRNSMKENSNSKQGWRSGSKSFTFVPIKKPANVHDDYDVAPVEGIELSNNGEIKTLPRHEEEAGQVAQQPRQASKPNSALPSYYKKFLGLHSYSS